MPAPPETSGKTFNLVQGTFVAYETSAGLLPTDYLRPEFKNAPHKSPGALSDRARDKEPVKFDTF